jgi:ribosomal-protein-alanine N-acetyltransferase
MIRVATPLDAALFESIHRHCFGDPWTEESFRALLSDAATFGFTCDDDAGEAFVLIRAAAGEAEVLTLATVPQARRRGLASLLLDAAIREGNSRGIRRLFLEVAETNQPALALYTKTGFSTVGKRSDYYASKQGPAVNALILRRDLNPEPAS